MSGTQQLVAIMYVSTLIFIAILFNIARTYNKGDYKKDD